MRDDAIDPEDDEDDEDADVEEGRRSALEEDDDDNVIGRMSSSSSSIAGLHNVSNTCYLNATVQVCHMYLIGVCDIFFFLSFVFAGPIQPTLSRDVFGRQQQQQQRG